MTLNERARAVRSREHLVAFLDALAADYGAHPSAWTNAELASFLGAMSAWARDMEGYYKNSGEDIDTLPPYRILADALAAARVYE